MLVVLAKGHGALAAQPGGEFFVGADQAVGAHGEHDGAQFVEHFVGAGGLGGDLGVEADERITQIVFDEHVVDAAGQRQGGDVMPARAFGVAPERDVGGLAFSNNSVSVCSLYLKSVRRRAFAHFAFPGIRRLPLREADFADDVVDVVDDAGDHDGRINVAGLLEEFGQGGAAAVFVFFGRDFFLGVDHVTGQVEQGFQEGDALQLTGFVLFLEFLQAFG